MADAPLTYSIDACDEAFVRDFCPYKGNPDPHVVWRAAWNSAMAQPPAAPLTPTDRELLELLVVTWGDGDIRPGSPEHWTIDGIVNMVRGRMASAIPAPTQAADAGAVDQKGVPDAA